MARENFSIVQGKLELRTAALAANVTELGHLEVPRQQALVLLTEMRDLSAQQASLTAAKQEVSKRLVALNDAGQKLLTLIDVGVRQHYGTRSEKLVEFGRQPFRSQPRIRVVGEDGKPLAKQSPTSPSPEAPPTTK